MDKVVRYEKDDVKKIDIKLAWGQLTMAAEAVEKLQIIATGDEETVKELRISCEDNEIFIEQPQYGISTNIVSSRWLEVVVRVPENWKIDMDVRTITGSINMKGLAGDEIEIETVSGKIVADGMEYEKIALKTINGKINANKFNGEKTKIRTVSGDVLGDNIRCKKMGIRSVSGGMTFNELTCEKIVSTSVSGKYLVRHAIPFKNYDVNTVSGDIILYAPMKDVFVTQRGLKGNIRMEGVREDAAGARIELTTVTGSVTIISTL